MKFSTLRRFVSRSVERPEIYVQPPSTTWQTFCDAWASIAGHIVARSAASFPLPQASFSIIDGGVREERQP